MADESLQPWEDLGERLRTGDAEALREFFGHHPPMVAIQASLRLTRAEQRQLIKILGPERVANFMKTVSETMAADLIEDLPPAEAAAIVDELRSDRQADLLGALGEEQAEAILQELRPEQAAELRALASYAPNTAGGLMTTEFLAFPGQMQVVELLDDLRENRDRYSDFEVQYAYVLGPGGTLIGILPMRDILFSARNRRLTELMISHPRRVLVTASLDELIRFFETHSFIGVPVVDAANRLVGVVRRAAVDEARGEEASSVLLKISGIIGGEEFRSMPLWLRSGRRLAFLSVNIVLNILAASVIALYQETLAAAITLAVFLPIISDMSGCSGNQAVAVSMRELSLGLVRPREIGRVVLKEGSLGVINGVALGALLALVALLWKGNPYLGLVVGTALAANTLLSVVVGGTLPLLLKRMKVDPALVSGPMLTTITDMCGFFLVLSLASAVLPRLT